jgi:hypothetical protein
MAEREPEEQLEELEKREKELDREIEETEQEWKSTQQEVPSADDGDAGDEPLDEDNPVGGV